MFEYSAQYARLLISIQNHILSNYATNALQVGLLTEGLRFSFELLIQKRSFCKRISAEEELFN